MLYVGNPTRNLQVRLCRKVIKIDKCCARTRARAGEAAAAARKLERQAKQYGSGTVEVLWPITRGVRAKMAEAPPSLGRHRRGPDEGSGGTIPIHRR